MKLNATETLDVNYFIASVTRQLTMGYRKMFIFMLYYCNFIFLTQMALRGFSIQIVCGEKDDSKCIISYSILVL